MTLHIIADILLVISLFICSLIYVISLKPNGVVEITETAPDEFKYLFIFTDPIEDIPKMKKITFKVKNIRANSNSYYETKES